MEDILAIQTDALNVLEASRNELEVALGELSSQGKSMVCPGRDLLLRFNDSIGRSSSLIPSRDGPAGPLHLLFVNHAVPIALFLLWTNSRLSLPSRTIPS